MDLDKDFDEEETDNLSECRIDNPTRNQEEEDCASIEPNEFIDEDPEEDIQSLESLNISYQSHKRQDEETVNSLSLKTEPDEQLDKARYFTELDVRWKYDDRHTEDEDQWEINFETNHKLFEPMVILSRLYSPTTSQAKTDEIFLDQKNERRIDIDNNSETKTQNT